MELTSNIAFGNTLAGTKYNGYTLTGWFQIVSGLYKYQTTSGELISIPPQSTLAPATAVAQATAQNVYNNLVADTKTLYENLLLLSYFTPYMSATEQATYYALIARFKIRQQLMNSDAETVQNISFGYPDGWIESYNKMESFYTAYKAKMGIVITTAMVVAIAGVIIASLATASYWRYTGMQKEANSDLNLSKELLQTKEKYQIAESDWNALTEHFSGAVSKAAITSKMQANQTWMTYLAIAAGAVVLYNYISK